MRTQVLNNGMEIPVLGLGTWEMGGRQSADRSNKDAAIKAVSAALEMGYRHIDTAEMYGNGEAEIIVGEAIKPFNRNDIFITTKIWPTNLSADSIPRSAEKSLKRLNTSFVDALLIHAPNNQIPLDESLNALQKLKQSGICRCIGVSNFDIDLLQEVVTKHPGLISICQNEYSLLSINQGIYTRGSHSEVIPYCQANQIVFTGWRPLGKGKIIDRGNEMAAIAKKYNCSIAQLALAWTIQQPSTTTLAKAINPSHLSDNLQATLIRLTPSDYSHLTTLFLK
ncbi:MAG: aldo/keto reductase [Bacteroidales bacterium]|nr:aldo/keto reductase [Bacteroidales bacterium]MDD3663637.1 aldo/keto reductase [Bacteroidales bacterium]